MLGLPPQRSGMLDSATEHREGRDKENEQMKACSHTDLVSPRYAT